MTILPMTSIDETRLSELIALAKSEDLGSGDITTSLLDDPTRAASFELIAKARGVFAGKEVAAAIVAAYDPAIELVWTADVVDGLRLESSRTCLATLRGALGSILAVERVLLNFLQRLSGIATLTRAFVDAVQGTSAAIYDTRKTTPGWRSLEKYAVRRGGGCNHRFGLHDAVLIKDNHLAGVPADRLAATLFGMLNRIDYAKPPKEIVVEAQSVEQVEQILKVVGVDVILLDNFDVGSLREAVSLRDHLGLRERVKLEASGGANLSTVRVIAATGVDRISVGALTHSAPALDIALDRI